MRAFFSLRSIPLHWLLSFTAALSLLSGCSHYRLGTSGQLGWSTIYVEPVQTKALLPQAQAIFSTQIREAIAKDARASLALSPDAADVTLTVTIADYRREVATVRAGDTGLARSFTVTLDAFATLRDNRTGKILFEKRPIQAQRDVFTDGGQQQAEYQMLPILAEVIAGKVAHAVLDVW
jgi:hypothetical protein